MVGKTLGPYRILERVGAGGMGVVYRARDDRLQRDVALKVLPDDAIRDDHARARLRTEAQSASSLNHPHICTIYDVGEADGRAYIAMEFVDGSLLSALIPADGLPPQTAVRYSAQIADALSHAHTNGLLHRDLKSSNVMVRRDGRAKVLDFGLAAHLEQEQALDATRSRQSFAERGVIVGTLHYLAPELLRAEPASPRSDIWALGVLLQEMVAGGLPFSGLTGFDISAAILRGSPAPLPADTPPGLQATIQRCLNKDPAERYQTAGEVRAALETLLAEKTCPPRTRPSRRMLYQARTELRGKWKYLLTVGLVIFATCLAAVLVGTAMAGIPARLERNAVLFFSVFVFYSAAMVALVVFRATHWSFVIYPHKLRAKGRWRTLDIPFDQIEGAELVSYRKSWRSLFLSWFEFRAGLGMRFKKLGEAAAMTFTGPRTLIKVWRRGPGWCRGYWLDMDKPERFFETLGRALERYRQQQKSSAPTSAS